MTETITRDKPQTAARTLVTYEDYLEIPNDGRRWEVIDGEPYVSPAPGTRHQTVLLELAVTIGTNLREHPRGRVLIAPLDVVLTDVDVVQPDLVYLRNEQMHRLREAALRGAPDLAVEILSESTRRIDEKVKLALYEHHGVVEYWVIDPVLETVKVRRRTGEGFGPPDLFEADAGNTLTTPLLPELEISLAELFSKSRLTSH